MCIRRERATAFATIVVAILLGATGLSARECSDTPPGVSSMARCCITFTGEASGGTLIFYKYLGGKAKCATVETMAGEPAERVIERLADVIEGTNPFGWTIVRGGAHETGARVVTSSGGELKGLVGDCGPYIIAGTEVGLGIPQPPHSLTCNYDREANSVSLRWDNPSPDAYDSIRIMFHRIIGGAILPGNSESYVLDLSKYSASAPGEHKLISELFGSGHVSSNIANDLNIWVIGVRNDIPSNAAAIHLNNNVQEELFGIPFAAGIAPNWQRWALDANENRISFDEGIRDDLPPVPNLRYHPVKTPQSKPFYQVINTGTQGGTGGVFRKFIGLTPGHTYRVKARVSTLGEPSEGHWSVSVHAAPNSPDGCDLSPRQMAGLDALPAMSPVEGAVSDKGLAAGRMALYDSSLTTKGKFKEISTGKEVRGREITDITLPQGIDSITVWVRCVSTAAMSAGIDWIGLEDLSVQNP